MSGCIIEVASWFISEDQRRFAHQRASNGDALALATGKLRGPVRETLGQPNPLELANGTLPGFDTGTAAIQQR